MLRKRNLLRPVYKQVVRANQTQSHTQPRTVMPYVHVELRSNDLLSLRLHGLQTRFRSQFKIKAWQYTYMSESYPHMSTAVQAGGILFSADVIAQSLVSQLSPSDSESSWNVGRSLIMGAFGFTYYGFPCKYVYFLYDKIFGSRRVVAKALVDCFLHAPFMLLPSYYAFTGILSGSSFREWTSKLRREWVHASLGTVAFWTPVQLICFKYIPMHLRVVWVCSCSLFHKTWLSWYSH